LLRRRFSMKIAPTISPREEFLAIPFMTAAQLCEELGICRASLISWRNEGMPYVPLGGRAVRYCPYDVMEWLRVRDEAYKARRASRGQYGEERKAA
jgi:predicted DNA-binding transcriptional regulator AlpA